MTTLAIIFQPVLTFPLFTTSLPEPSSIFFYTFIPTPVLEFYPDLPVYNPLFMHHKLLKDATGLDVTKPPEYNGDNYYGDPNLRLMLHPEIEERIPSSKRNACRALQGKGLTVITTFAWDAEQGVATFWMNRVRMDMMKASGEWVVAMGRTDNWTCVTMPVPVKEVRGAKSGINNKPPR